MRQESQSLGAIAARLNAVCALGPPEQAHDNGLAQEFAEFTVH